MQGYALELTGPKPLSRPFSARGDPTITLLYLKHALGAASIDPGWIPAASGGPSRSLPDFIAAYQRDSGGDWRELEALPERLATFRFPGFDVTECAALGGCYRTEEQANEEDCRLPCGPESPRPPATPMSPEPPRFEPCPSGWTTRPLEEVIVCDPPERLPCPPGRFQRIGDAGCTTIGEPCPDGPFAENLQGQVVYVNAGEPLQDAIASAPAGATLALAKGVHTAGITPGKDLVIAGACAEETILIVPPGAVGIDAGDREVHLSGLTLSGGQTAARSSGGRLTLDGVRVEGPASAGVAAESGTVVIDDSQIRGVDGPALTAAGAVVDVRESVVTDLDTTLGAFKLDAGSSGRITDVVVETSSSGALLVSGASVELERMLVAGLTGLHAVEVADDGSLAADLLLVRDVAGRTADADSHAVVVDGARATLTRLLLERVTQHGLVAVSATASVSDALVHTVAVPSHMRVDRRFGQGIYLGQAAVGVERVWLYGLSWAGIRVLESELAGSDLLVDGVSRSERGMRSGVEIDGSSVELTRLAASRIDGESVSIFDSDAVLSDVHLERDGDSPDPFGFECGLAVSGRSDVAVSRLRSERLNRKGACVRQGVLRVADYTALDVADQAFYLIDEGIATLERATLDGAADGLVAFERTQLEASDITIRNMHGEVTHVPETMLGFPRGRGIYNNAMARVRVERFLVTDCEDAGLDISGRDSIHLFDGRVTRNLIGARLTFDPRDLLLGSTVSGNEIDFSQN